jgi:hypothetical protein
MTERNKREMIKLVGLHTQQFESILILIFYSSYGWAKLVYIVIMLYSLCFSSLACNSNKHTRLSETTSFITIFRPIVMFCEIDSILRNVPNIQVWIMLCLCIGLLLKCTMNRAGNMRIVIELLKGSWNGYLAFYLMTWPDSTRQTISSIL